jgi:hypothetical protein
MCRLTEPLLLVANSKVRTMLGCSNLSPRVASSSLAFVRPFMPVWCIICGEEEGVRDQR